MNFTHTSSTTTTTLRHPCFVPHIESGFTAEMCIFWHNQLNSETPIKCYQGKSYKIGVFGRSASVLVAIWLFVFLGFAICGFCHELPMVSVPLGFEISGYDRSRIWVSQNGVYSFGFMQSCEKDDDGDGFVVGIRYNFKSKASNVPVWTIGGGLRVSEESTLRLSKDGRLVLVENPSGLILWSSNTSSLGVEKASLLNNGNLVLMDIGDNVVWESFNGPTSTLLPGQSLHFPQTLRAPSTKSISSYYNFVIRRSGELALVWESNVTYWRSHLSSPAVIKEARFDSNGVLRLIDDSNTTVWSKSSKDFEGPSTVLRRLRIDSDGNLRIYSWDDVVHTWRVGWQAVEDQCNVFGSCGLYSICGYNSTGPVCDCLFPDSLNWENDPLGLYSGSISCKKMVDLGNCKMNTSIMVLKQTVLYGLYPPLDVDIMLGEEACKEYCSNDTTCIAVTSKNDGSGVCTVKRTSFISGYSNPSVPSSSFLKVCLVPEAASARGAYPHSNAELTPVPSRRSIARGYNSKKFVGAIALIVFMTISVFLTVEMFVFWIFYRRRQIKAQTGIPFAKDARMNLHFSVLVRLTFKEVKELSDKFGSQLGPSVFKGMLPNKTPIIAKVLNDVVASEKDFRVRVAILGATHHRNIVPLKGFCFEPNHKIILYEYIPNGSLDNWLFNMRKDQNEGDWQQRLGIALGVARALAYLHTECQTCIAHGNLKLENVLLDKNLSPRVTDYGLGCLLEKDAHAPSCSESLPERDIYMFGEMLLQIATCKRDIPGEDLHHIANMIRQEQKLKDSEEREGVERVVRIGLWCIQHQPFLRPSIGEVVKVLEGTLSVGRPPSALGFKQESCND